ncbi:hypothetical protein D3C79_701620 [compost metagenome]
MHEDDTQADQHGTLQVMLRAHALAIEAGHRHPGHTQCNQQRKAAQGGVVVHFQRCPERQHADEMHRPDPSGQAASTQHAPLPLGSRLFAVGLALGHVQGGKAGSAGHSEGDQDQ